MGFGVLSSQYAVGLCSNITEEEKQHCFVSSQEKAD